MLLERRSVAVILSMREQAIVRSLWDWCCVPWSLTRKWKFIFMEYHVSAEDDSKVWNGAEAVTLISESVKGNLQHKKGNLKMGLVNGCI